MVQLNQQFNAKDVEPSTGSFDPLPTGWYPAILQEDEKRATAKAKRGECEDWYANLMFSIVGEKYANRKIFKMLNLQNESEQAMEIAYRELSALCHACGRLSISDVSELRNIPVSIHLKMVPAVKDGQGNEKYPAKNEINGFQALEGEGEVVAPAPGTPAANGTATAENPAATPATETVANAKPPWEK